jgi:hypothetical protein
MLSGVAIASGYGGRRVYVQSPYYARRRERKHLVFQRNARLQRDTIRNFVA